MEQIFLSPLKKYGLIGLILGYFIMQDYATREIDRAVRKRHMEVLESLSHNLVDINTRVTILEVRMEKVEEFKKGFERVSNK